jgi:hypothetical protein
MKTSFGSFAFLATSLYSSLAVNIATFAAAEEEPNKEGCMAFCAEEIENIVFTTESLKSSMQATIENLQSELDKVRDESDMKDQMIEKARQERAVWKSKADSISSQIQDLRFTLRDKQNEVNEYRNLLDDKEKAKIDGIQQEKEESAKKSKERYEAKLKLDEEMAERKARRDNGEDDDDEDDGGTPEIGSKKYFVRVIENLEFTMDSVIKSSHNCQHQLSQCLGKEIHPLIEQANAIERNLSYELNGFLKTRMNVNWCLLKHDFNDFWSYIGLGYSYMTPCKTTNDVKVAPPKALSNKQQARNILPPEHLAAQAKVKAMSF